VREACGVFLGVIAVTSSTIEAPVDASLHMTRSVVRTPVTEGSRVALVTGFVSGAGVVCMCFVLLVERPDTEGLLFLDATEGLLFLDSTEGLLFLDSTEGLLFLDSSERLLRVYDCSCLMPHGSSTQSPRKAEQNQK
jgi:hypothetical protein